LYIVGHDHAGACQISCPHTILYPRIGEQIGKKNEIKTGIIDPGNR